MDFLGPDYLEALSLLAEFKDDYPGLLKELRLCEPRAAIALYPESNGNNYIGSSNNSRGSSSGSGSGSSSGSSSSSSSKGKTISETSYTKRMEDVDMDSVPDTLEEADQKNKKKLEEGKAATSSKLPNGGVSTLDELLAKFPAPVRTPPRHPELDLYFALYIWVYLALGEYLNAVSIVKRYGLDAPLFVASPLVVASARAARLFDPQTYAHTLAQQKEHRNLETTLLDDKKADIKAKFDETKRVAALWDYSKIYALREAYAWDEDIKEDKTEDTNANGNGAVTVGKLVDEALAKFRRTVHGRIVSSFGTIRPATVVTYLGLRDVGDESGEAVLAALKRELGDEAKGWTMKSTEGSYGVTELLVPPVQIPRPQQNARTTAEKRAQMQELISAATHLEQRLGV
ncbi:uncharacterized protein SAPINGB_P001538 [Magnusiomyces paraingens]|uniref:Uncharacterized protein n=1 Tax=Magnusiomyces paraingens TaxID=2606893 RepID=A0A5E8BCD3_9ASCO|nr:uncharacterized protein SAPINGB_P001538 [Saprochaete ingens]VVT47091.1 unnamed protein product [Saprochaete ingens]